MNIEPFLIPGLFITGLSLFLCLLVQTIEKPVIGYFLVQFTVVWVFLGQNLLSPLGLDIKLHIIFFLLVTLVSMYFIYRNFAELWAYKPFQYLFLFFLISSVYAVCYKTDFGASGYIDSWVNNNPGLKNGAVEIIQGASTGGSAVSEVNYMVYLIGLAPLVAFVSGFMVFFPRKKRQKSNLSPQSERINFIYDTPQKDFSDFDTKKAKLQNLISWFSFGVLIYFTFFVLSVMSGVNTMGFLDGRLTVGGAYTGEGFEAMFLVLLAVFYLYIKENRDFKLFSLTKASIIINIIILSLLILLGMHQGTIFALFIAAHIPVYSILAVKLYNREKIPFNPLSFIVPTALVCILMLFAPGVVENTIEAITERFSSEKILQMKQINWELYNQHWLDNLNFFKALFGFGIDSSKEAIFFLSAMHPDPVMQQPHIHNIYLEMFYNYGFMAVLYFLPILLIFTGNLMDILKNKYNNFNCLAATVVIFFLMFYTAESPKTPLVVTFFSLVGFLESIRLHFHYEERKI